MQSVRHTLPTSGPHFASAPPQGPRWQTRRRFGSTLVVRLRALRNGPFWRPEIITPSKHYKYSDWRRRPDRGPRKGQEQLPTHCNVLQRTLAYNDIPINTRNPLIWSLGPFVHYHLTPQCTDFTQASAYCAQVASPGTLP